VSYIVGRDTARLDAPEITRATVETVAENIVDGIIAPLFYAMAGSVLFSFAAADSELLFSAAIGSTPLAFLYRAVNTMDSMLGYKNEKYRDFGMAAARVDDVFNYIPARLTGMLIVLAAFLLSYDAKGALRSILRDARKHPSPNSGFAEAGVAGALGVRLGGLNFYGGVSSFRAYMGEAKTPLRLEHIQAANRIMYVTTFLFVPVIVLLKGAGLFIAALF
ncbi:MAG: adenosylcobinamide-phosphate synthase CbiB, partial [Sporomusaceae bacterium]|nr:adenosylcobinamide-phosphate synthase CbiB [Sporomusaceae bacterium]